MNIIIFLIKLKSNSKALSKYKKKLRINEIY